MARKKKLFYIIDKHYFIPGAYVLKAGRKITLKGGKEVWHTTLILGPVKLVRMLLEHGKQLAEENNTRLLVGIKNYQIYKRSDITKEYNYNELLKSV